MTSKDSDGFSSRNLTGKNEHFIDWEDYFMGIALLSSLRSKDPCVQVGACIVNDENKIVGVGYNGFPKGCSDDVFSWEKNKGTLANKRLYVCHAEVNAILNRNCCNAKGCKIYVTLFPCNECVKFIIQVGIKEIIYLEKKEVAEKSVKQIAAEKMLNATGLKYRKFCGKNVQFIMSLLDVKEKLEQEPPKKKPREEETNCGAIKEE